MVSFVKSHVPLNNKGSADPLLKSALHILFLLYVCGAFYARRIILPDDA